MKGTIKYTLNLHSLIFGNRIDHECEVEIEYDGPEVISVTAIDLNNPNPDMYDRLDARDWERVGQAITDALCAAADRMRD